MARGYAGLKEFRDLGGALVFVVYETDGRLDIGTSPTNILFRLRSGKMFPNAVKKVPREFVFRFEKVKNQILQVRTVIACGEVLVFHSKSGSHVIAGRHPDFKHDLIDLFLAKTVANAERNARGTIEEKLDRLLHDAPFVQTLSDKVEDLQEEVESVKKDVRPLKFKRGADAEVEHATRPMAAGLNGYHQEK